MYADLDFYQNRYYGDALTEANANRWLSRAGDEIDALTFGRLVSAFPVTESDAEKVRKAVCAVADALFYTDVQRIAASAQKDADGQYHGAVSSVTSGKESVSYSVSGNAATAYASAAANPDALTALVRNIAVKYLANVPDANGVNLLYAGV